MRFRHPLSPPLPPSSPPSAFFEWREDGIVFIVEDLKLLHTNNSALRISGALCKSLVPEWDNEIGVSHITKSKLRETEEDGRKTNEFWGAPRKSQKE